MRLGIDLIALQTETRGRGIGRSCRDLVRALRDGPGDDELVLYRYGGLPDEVLEDFPEAHHRLLPCEPGRAGDAIDDLARENPDRLDVLLVPSPFEEGHGYRPPGKWPRSPRLVAVVHDLIPLIFPEHYLWKERAARRFFAAAEVLRQYDGYLTNSECTRSDLIRFLGVRQDRAAVVGWACDPHIFRPAAGAEPPTDNTLPGLDSPFFLCIAGPDYRKNVSLLIDAYAEARRSFPSRLPLLIVCGGDRAFRDRAAERGTSLEVGDDLILIDRVDDRELAELYRHCWVFLFPSAYEGFGLPILEAMSCGAAVLAARNSSQEEVLGDAGRYFERLDVPTVAAAIAAIARDPRSREELRRSALAQAGAFRWEDCARRAMDALGRFAGGSRGPAVDPTFFVHRGRMAFELDPDEADPGALDSVRRAVEYAIPHHHVEIYCRGNLPMSFFPLRLPARIFDARLKARRWPAPALIGPDEVATR